MGVVVEENMVTDTGKGVIETLAAEQDNFMNQLHSSVDEAVRHELDRLKVEEGIVPTCKAGCFQCCGQHILISIAEAKALAHYIQREFTQPQIDDLKIRTQEWHKWDDSRPVRPRLTEKNEQPSVYTHHYCPMLVEGVCSAYPVRPVTCRSHFVSSPPPVCKPFYDPDLNKERPVAVSSVLLVTKPHSTKIRHFIENSGLYSESSIMLLPHWLAVEMHWDFAISP
jgi:Fe-S-cluster containining protein